MLQPIVQGVSSVLHHKNQIGYVKEVICTAYYTLKYSEEMKITFADFLFR